MEMLLEHENDPNPESNNNRRSYSPIHQQRDNPIATGPTIEELLSIKCESLNEADQTDIATTIRNAILIPNNLNVSDDCLRTLCNRREQQDTSVVLDTTAESPEKSFSENVQQPASLSATKYSSQSSSGSEAISDQDLRCVRDLSVLGSGSKTQPERRVLRQVSPLPKGVIISGTPILNGENSGNAVFNRIGEDVKNNTETSPKADEVKQKQLTFNGRIPPPPAPRHDHVIIQIEPEESKCDLKIVKIEGGVVKEEQIDEELELETEKNESNTVEVSFEYTNERSPDLFADLDEDDDDEIQVENEEDEIPDNPEDVRVEEQETVEPIKLVKEEPLPTEIVWIKQEPVEEKTRKEPKLPIRSSERLRQRDNHLLKRIQSSCSGVVPPPSVTNVAISMDVILARYKEFNGQLPDTVTKQEVNRNDNDDEEEEIDTTEDLYLMKSVDPLSRAATESWPELKNVICHDVYYNLSNASEQYEYLTVKYRSRFLGTETASSFVAVDLSSAKKRANRTKALQSNTSPGRRLSHLARRRAIFSCANLQGAKDAAAQAQKAAVDLSRVANRQILLPNRRKGRTPGKKRKTPGSSAKKRSLLATSALHQRREILTREASKRALFQSPGNKDAAAMEDTAKQQPAKPKVTPEVAIRVDKSKRALFSSPKFGRFPTFSGSAVASTASSSRMELSRLRYSSMNNLSTTAAVERGSQESLLGKRKRNEESDEDEENSDQLKVLRTESPTRSSFGSNSSMTNDSLTGIETGTGKNFMRSQSFTAEQLHRQKSSLGLPRTSSEIYLAGGTGQVLALTDTEKKKLLWTVSMTLQRNQVNNTNPRFKDYAIVMARVVKRMYLENVNKMGALASVTEQMSRLANNIAFQVLQNKNELEIYSAEKLKFQSQNRKKLTGYINSTDYERYKATDRSSSLRRMSSGVFSETSSVTLSQSSMVSGSSAVTTIASTTNKTTDENRESGDPSLARVVLHPLEKAPPMYNVLRENVDTEQRLQQQLRLSSQKFSGKDQKNVSPYSGDGIKRKLLVGGAGTTMTTATLAKGLNVIKAKRQISFDT